MSGINPEIKVYDLKDPRSARHLREFVGNLILDVVSILGPGFQAHDEDPWILAHPNSPLTKAMWRCGEIDVSQLQQLDKVANMIRDDIVATGMRHFMRMPMTGPEGVDATRVERNGFTFKLIIVAHPHVTKQADVVYMPMLRIEWVGWK